MDQNAVKILAVDPGYDRCGAAIFENKNLLYSECITTKKTDPHQMRLSHIYTELSRLIETWQPQYLALETLFFSVNKKTALKVAEARGVVLVAAGKYNMSLVEMSPQEVKIATTGAGNADKAQMQKMIGLSFTVSMKEKIDDEIDAIAIGAAAAQKIKFQKFS